MSRTLSASLLAFALLLAALPCRAADLEAACAKFNSCYNGGGHDVCWRRQESQLLSKRDAKASREGAALHVITSRGPVIFTDTLDLEKNVEGAWYRYLGFFPDIGQHLIGVAFFEGKDFLLVSHATGEFVGTGETPHLSPNGKWIAVADISADYSEESLIKIWALEGGRLRLEYSEPSKADGSHFVRWEDEFSFTVDEFMWGDSENSICQDKKKAYLHQRYIYRWERGVLTRSLAREPNFSCKEHP